MTLRPLYPLTLALLAGCASKSPPRARCAPLSGSIAETMTGPSTAAGTITGSLAGAISIVIDSTAAGAGGGQTFIARHTIVTAPGDTLRTTDAGTMQPVSAHTLAISNSLTLRGGSGRFSGATGSITTQGELNTGAAAIALRYQGELCTNL